MLVADLLPYIGPRNRVYEVLNGTRPLTMSMIRRLLTKVNCRFTAATHSPAPASRPPAAPPPAPVTAPAACRAGTP